MNRVYTQSLETDFGSLLGISYLMKPLLKKANEYTTLSHTRACAQYRGTRVLSASLLANQTGTICAYALLQAWPKCTRTLHTPTARASRAMAAALGDVKGSLRTGLIMHVDGDDHEACGKYGMAIDNDLITMDGERAFITLDTHHYQVRRVFGIGNRGENNSNRWVSYLKELRESVMALELTKAFRDFDKDSDIDFKPSASASRGLMWSKVSQYLEVLVPRLSADGAEFVLTVRKAARWNSAFIFELTDDSLTHLINAFYVEPPVAMTKKRQRDDTVPYADYPHVKAGDSRGRKVLWVWVRVGGIQKKVSKSVPLMCSDGHDGGAEAELKIANDLEDHYRTHHEPTSTSPAGPSRASNDLAGDAEAGDDEPDLLEESAGDGDPVGEYKAGIDVE